MLLLPKGETLFIQGQETDLYELKSGLLKITRTQADGACLLFNIITPGEVFPHHSLISPQVTFGTASALVHSEIERISASSWYQALEQSPEKYRDLALILQKNLQRLQKRVVMTTVATPERIPLFREWLHTYCPGVALEEILTQEEIGQFLGMTRETVNRYLRKEKS